MPKFSILATLLISFHCFSQSSDTTTFSVVNSGNIKGFLKTWKNPGGSFGYWYQYNDRGRGDSMRVEYREDAQGFPVWMKATGKDYMKNPVFEDFSWENRIAKWKNNSEEQQKTVTGKAFYQGLKSQSGHLVKALRANGNKINTLPTGEVSMIVLEQIKLGSGGKPVYLVQLNGLDLTPSYSWVDEKDEDFASVSEWNSTILRDYEKYVDTLLSRQKKYEVEFFNQLAAALPEIQPEFVLIKNVNVFDAVNATMMNGQDVLIRNGRIEKIAAANNIQQPTAKIIDGRGKTALPGLWDMHVHMTSDLDGILHMAAGVTHVRDMGNSAALLGRMEKINQGKIIGPRLEIISGLIDGAGPFAAPTGALINNVEEGIKAIDNYASKGYQQIKLYSSIKPEWVIPLVNHAKEKNLRVCGHIPAFMTATSAINAGYNEVTHMNMLALNFFGDTIDTRSPLRFSIPAKKTATLDLQGTEMKKFIQLLKDKKITVDPTLGVFEGMFTSREKLLDAAYVAIVDHLPLQWQRTVRAGGGGLPVPEGMDETFRKSFTAFLQITKLLYDNNIRIVAGTDGTPGFALHRELELYVQAGIPANKVLQLATFGAANYTGKAKEIGSIEKGKLADLILVDGNPAENISDIRKVKWVITQGRIYESGKLYSAISIKPF